LALTRQELGKRAEQAAAEFFVAQGFQVLARNRRVGRLELDLIIRDGPVVAVVEVRTRGEGAWQRGLDSIGPAKRARVRNAGTKLWRLWVGKIPGVERMRFDAASVSFLPDGEVIVEHIPAAF
jgi:putative endonuclease